jgi:uncharacterized membrane protein YbaN (DUF454 family)
MKIALIIIGTISTALGVLGIFLPLLPTTPFLLLATACYARSSTRFHSWLLNNPVLGEYIRNYTEKRALTRRTKITGITVLWVAMIPTVVFIVSNWILRLVFLGIAVAVTVHLVRLGTLSE